MNTGDFSRREFLKIGAGGTLGLALGPHILRPALAADTITFATITPGTGPYGYAGDLVIKGATLAIEERGPEILGRKIRLVTRDDEGKPAVGVRRLSEVIASEGARYFNGNYSSAVGLAQSEIAQKRKVLQYAAGGSEDFSGSRCNRYTFQWSANAYTALKALIDYVSREMPNAKRWYTITADYVFGHSLLKYAKIVGERKGIEFVGNDSHPLGERQYNQYLTKVIAATPDVLCLLNGGSDAVTTVRQFHGYGASNIRVVAPWAIEVDQMPELTPEMRDGLILGQNYYHTVDNPTNKAFVAKYREKYGSPPAYASAYGYDSFRAILLAMEKAMSIEVADVIRALEGMTYDSVVGTATIDPETHQTVRPYFIVKGTPASQMRSDDDFADVVFEGSDPQPKDMNECKDLGPI
jgi:branched-chain amino acid transport system substrate-binding protein